MAALIAREVLRRYPRLRQTWPVQQAQIWRDHRAWRQRPRRMASWYRDAADMRTRLIVSNLEIPEAPQACTPATVMLRLLDQDGAMLASKRVHLARNASVVQELGELLPAARRGHLESGQVIADFEAP